MTSRRIPRYVAGLLVSCLVLTGCQPDDSKNTSPLPTASVTGKVVCGFASQESFVTALGTSDFSLNGSMPDLRGSKNPDGSKLSQAGCSAFTKDAPLEALKISVRLLNAADRWDAVVPSKLAAGGLDFVFPTDEGLGFATAGKNADDDAAQAHLIVGDWHYFVSIHPHVKGRDAVQDAVALIRQTVTQLNLPKTGKLPRPTATPSS
ncbi:hypothetical protein OG474_24675 [Kribbella sp. NBC_01505]|uniref:hypothetical protein n=1 Tax=Kribbella sp. NBC_01505 TaxID=2903580 RepID=UPI0038643432